MLRRTIVLIAAAAALAQTRKVYPSPDRKFEAAVTTNAAGEAVVEFRQMSDRYLMHRRDDRSSDGQHGRTIEHAAWTPDSKWFVASTMSSGGHQPLMHPTWVYSRVNNEVFELWKYGFTVTSDFQVEGVDRIHLTVLCNQRDRRVVLPLPTLLGGRPENPCPAQ